jgi:hypothetical protein
MILVHISDGAYGLFLELHDEQEGRLGLAILLFLA